MSGLGISLKQMPGYISDNATGNAAGNAVRTQETETETRKIKAFSGETSSPQAASPMSPVREDFLLSQTGLSLVSEKVLYRMVCSGGKTYYEVTESYFKSKMELSWVFPLISPSVILLSTHLVKKHRL